MEQTKLAHLIQTCLIAGCFDNNLIKRENNLLKPKERFAERAMR